MVCFKIHHWLWAEERDPCDPLDPHPQHPQPPQREDLVRRGADRHRAAVVVARKRELLERLPVRPKRISVNVWLRALESEPETKWRLLIGRDGGQIEILWNGLGSIILDAVTTRMTYAPAEQPSAVVNAGF